MNAARLKSIAYVTAIFLVGGVTGASIALSVGHKKMNSAVRGRDMIQVLTSDQVNKINPIVEKLGEEMRAIHLDAMQRTGKLIDSAHDQIAAELTPDQKHKLERFEKERHDSMRERHEGMHDRPPFPPYRRGKPPGGPMPPGGPRSSDHRPPHPPEGIDRGNPDYIPPGPRGDMEQRPWHEQGSPAQPGIQHSPPPRVPTDRPTATPSAT